MLECELFAKKIKILNFDFCKKFFLNFAIIKILDRNCSNITTTSFKTKLKNYNANLNNVIKREDGAKKRKGQP